MSGRSFFSDEAKRRVEEVVREIEATSAAEIVVAVRATSGSYAATDVSFGAAAAMAMLAVFLYHPEPFDWTWLPLELAVFGTLAGLACRAFDPLRRILTLPSARRENAERAAKAMFVDRGLSRTRGRTGVLVYVAVFEARVVIVEDVGVDRAAIEPACRVLEGSAAGFSGVDRFVEALRGLRDPLARILPRAEDDVNELPDEVSR